ncbi:hypothetical protein CONCODRAFT_62130 [Conidiobolus coronatus NRRL 28638]|uniref:RRM domain-containing protein n=1 Tax=Conidiobolus coronatus (strain ATCC 28846 / CBS 209.66 / NRRL 28638) TaxID=796925 RepID=A0A137NS57_CONC2|nr:hypothetical protein CONCODRAFT_62130 [Conidiobolus coronatus NRRL 28638]|eukprot:KXN65578.1 hypothetical protein CONCODRAFT_62130 [Conidiobolus coronatus NRRL 28638]
MSQFPPPSNPPVQQQQQSSAADGSRTLYVGNLDTKVTEYMLLDIFATCGHVLSVKIIQDKNPSSPTSASYGFVEFQDSVSAEQALQTLNGRKIYGLEIKVNWAFASNNSAKEDTSSHFHIFIGDLSSEVNDALLNKAFSPFGTMSDARVMWDPNTGKSRGYGFVAYRNKSDAELAISSMNGQWLGNRSIRVNWANQKGANAETVRGGKLSIFILYRNPTFYLGPSSNASSAPAPGNMSNLNYETVLTQSSPYNTTVYIGNITPNTTQENIAPLFQQYGYIIEMRVQADRGFAFVKLTTHENAAMAIVGLNGTMVNGRPIKCSWGKDRTLDPNNPYPPAHMVHGYGYGYNAPPVPYGAQDYRMAQPAGSPQQFNGAQGGQQQMYEYGYDYSQYYSAYPNAAPHSNYGSYPPSSGQPPMRH